MLAKDERKLLNRLVTTKPTQRAIDAQRAYLSNFPKLEWDPGFSVDGLAMAFKAPWSLHRALTRLGIELEAFEPRRVLNSDLEVDGYAYNSGRTVSISHNAGYPTHTLIHELAHCVDWGPKPNDSPGIKEFVADGAGCVVLHRLKMFNYFSWDESHYRCSKMLDQVPTEAHYARVDVAVQAILSAGIE